MACKRSPVRSRLPSPANLKRTSQSLSSRGLGHRPFTAITGVRIPVGTPKRRTPATSVGVFFTHGHITMIETLQCLKKHGQRLDLEIATEMRVPLATVRRRLAGLAASGAVITCNLT